MEGPRLFRHRVFDTGRVAARGGIPLSMIDVVFLLLVFLLLGQFPIAEGLLSMPLAGRGPAREAQPRRTLWIQVEPGSDGGMVYKLNDWPATGSREQLLSDVRDLVRVTGRDELAVVIGVEGDVPFERLVELWEACREMGIEELALPAGAD